MTNWDIINLINTVRNRDLEGEDATITELQSLINAKSHLLFAKNLGLPKEYQLNAPIARMGAGVSRKVEQDLRPFYRAETKTVAGGNFAFSSLANEVGYLLAINPATILGRGFDELSADEIADRLGSSVVAPTEKDPAFCWNGADSILIYPSSITQIKVIYYKIPTECVIATTTNPTTLRLAYDAANSVELEWNDEQKVEIAYMVLEDLGYNMQRADLINLAAKNQ